MFHLTGSILVHVRFSKCLVCGGIVLVLKLFVSYGQK
jgi:hypothetical protein